MKSNYKNIGLALFLLFTVQMMSAQDSVQVIDLEKVMDLGGANNLTIQKYKQLQQVAVAEVAKAREWWLPDIYAGTVFNQLWGAAMNGNGLFFENVNSQNFWAGIGAKGAWNFRGIYRTKAKNIRAQAVVQQTAAEKNKVLIKSIEAYYDFLSAQLYFMAYEQLLAQSDTIINQIELQVAAGLRYESEVLIARSNQRHLEVERMQAKMEQSRKAAVLMHLLNLSPDAELLCTDSLLTPIELVADLQEIKVDESVYKNRPEFNAASLMLQSMEMENKVSTIGLWLPEVRFSIYGSLFGDMDFDLATPLYPTSALNLSLIWTLPLGNLTYKGDKKLFDAKVELQKIEVEELKAVVHEEVVEARGIMKIAKLQMSIAQEGRELAEKALSQSIQRQQLGTVLPFEILQVQEVYIKARLDYLNAVTAYNKAQYALFVALGNDL